MSTINLVLPGRNRALLLHQQTTARAICNADGPRGIMHRMNSYSEDLRKKIVEALRRGMTKSEAARTFSVSRRSEEHTSELQSRQYLVCRLLLEKKKKNKYYSITSA